MNSTPFGGNTVITLREMYSTSQLFKMLMLDKQNFSLHSNDTEVQLNFFYLVIVGVLVVVIMPLPNNKVTLTNLTSKVR